MAEEYSTRNRWNNRSQSPRLSQFQFPVIFNFCQYEKLVNFTCFFFFIIFKSNLRRHQGRESLIRLYSIHQSSVLS